MKKVNDRIVSIQNNPPTIDVEILNLKNDGFSIMESIKIIRTGYGLSLEESKRLVSSHSVWREHVESNREFHDLLEKMIMAESKTEFRRLGGFTAFPLFPAKFDIGPYNIVWKDWLFLSLFEVRKNGSLYFKTNVDSKVIKNGKVAGYILNKENSRKTGVRFEGEIEGTRLTTVCEDVGKANERSVIFKSIVGQKEIGEFRWDRLFQEKISGFFNNEMAEYTWFMGISLMCLWRNERDVKSGF